MEETASRIRGVGGCTHPAVWSSLDNLTLKLAVPSFKSRLENATPQVWCLCAMADISTETALDLKCI